MSLYAATLSRAARIIGSESRLSFVLGVPAATLQRWIEGLDRPPVDAFLKAVDIVLEESMRSSSGHTDR